MNGAVMVIDLCGSTERLSKGQPTATAVLDDYRYIVAKTIRQFFGAIDCGPSGGDDYVIVCRDKAHAHEVFNAIRSALNPLECRGVVREAADIRVRKARKPGPDEYECLPCMALYEAGNLVEDHGNEIPPGVLKDD